MIGVPLAREERALVRGERVRRIEPIDPPIVEQFWQAVIWRPFVVFAATQWFIGVVVNFAVPMAFFCVIFLRDGPYELLSGQTVSTVLMSPLITSVAAPLFVPLSLPGAAKRGWLVPLRVEAAPWIFRPGKALVRHAAGGLILSGLCAPMGFAVAAVLSPMKGWTFIFAMAAYIAAIAAMALPPAIVLLCTHANLAHIDALFEGNPLLVRALRCFCC